MTSEYTPITEEVRSWAAFVPEASVGMRWSDKDADAFDRWLTKVRAEAAAEALTKLATHLDGGTPRAWGFHHPCDPPGKRWEPDEADRALMMAADIAREQAARALADKGTP